MSDGLENRYKAPRHWGTWGFLPVCVWLMCLEGVNLGALTH
jgi:hypothetical protein